MPTATRRIGAGAREAEDGEARRLLIGREGCCRAIEEHRHGAGEENARADAERKKAVDAGQADERRSKAETQGQEAGIDGHDARAGTARSPHRTTQASLTENRVATAKPWMKRIANQPQNIGMKG